MESLVFLSACLKRDAVEGIVENLEPFANIDKQDGIVYYRAIVTLKLLFALHTMKIAFPEILSQLMLVIGNVYVATMCPEIAVLSAIGLCFQLLSPITGNRFVFYITMAFIGAISMNIKQYEFVLDIYVLISILWYAFETYNREIQKLCSVVSVVLTVGWYACKEYVKNPILLNKCSICAFLVLAYASLRPNRGNKHRHRLLYFYALFFMWLLYQFHQFSDTKFNVIGEINKTHSDVISHALGTDSMQHCSEKVLYDTNSKNALTAKKIDNGTCSESHSDYFKDSISTKDNLFSESGKSKKYFKDVNSGEGPTMQSDASKPCSENSILQKSLLSNMNHGSVKMTEINDKEKPKMQSTTFTTIDERINQRMNSSLSDIEDTSSQVKKNKNEDVCQEQNDRDTVISETLKVEPHQKQIVSAVPAQNEATESYQIKEMATQSEEVSKQNEESELSQNKGKDFLTKTVDISSDDEESELPIIDKTIINVPVRAPEIKNVRTSQNKRKDLLPKIAEISFENEESESPVTDKTIINDPVRAPEIKNVHTSQNKRNDLLPKKAEISFEKDESESPVTDKTIINVPVRAAEMKKVHSASSNTQANMEETLNRDSIDVTPTGTKLDVEVNKEFSSNFGERNDIANVDTIKLETETIINEGTEQNIRIENRKNLDVGPVNLSANNDDELNNDKSKLLKNINVPVRAGEIKVVHGSSSNTQPNVEDVLNRDKIDVMPTNTKLDAEVTKELLSDFGETNDIANVDTMKPVTETIIKKETEQNVKLENRKNVYVLPADLSANDDEWNNAESKMIRNILNLIDFKVDFVDSTGKKLNVKVKDTNEEQSDLSEELGE